MKNVANFLSHLLFKTTLFLLIYLAVYRNTQGWCRSDHTQSCFMLSNLAAYKLLPSTFWKESPVSATDATSVRRPVLWGPTDQCCWTLQALRECFSHSLLVFCHPAIKNGPVSFTLCPFFSIEYQNWSCGLTSKLIPFHPPDLIRDTLDLPLAKK